jgi:hypothetical protein
MKKKIRITAAAGLAGALLAGIAPVTGPASASAERMYLECESGTLAGTNIERSNGASWWDVTDGTVYTTRSIRIEHAEYGLVHEHTYGKKSGPADTCTADHFGFIWTVEVVRAGAR